MNVLQADVVDKLKAMADGIGKKQSEEALYNLYQIAADQLNTPEQREALRLGTMAMILYAYRMKVRAFLYERCFRRAYRRLK